MVFNDINKLRDGNENKGIRANNSNNTSSSGGGSSMSMIHSKDWVSSPLISFGDYALGNYDNDIDPSSSSSGGHDLHPLPLNVTYNLNTSQITSSDSSTAFVLGTFNGIIGSNNNNNLTTGNATRFLDTPTFDDASLTKMIVFSTMFFLSLFGNMATLIQMRRLRRRKNTINTLIINLALADLLVTFFCIAGDAVWAATTQWLAGNVVCKLFKFMQAFSLYLSTFITVAISLDRCVAILDPMRRNSAAQRVRFMIVTAWIFSALFSIPQVFVFNVQRGPFKVEFFQCVTFGNYLSPWQMQMYAIASLMFMFVLPLAVIGTAYTLIFTTISRKSKEHSVMDGVQMPSNKSLVTRWVNYKNYLCLTICRTAAERHNSITSSCSVEQCRGPVRSHLLRKAKRKSLRMSFVIVMAFVVCWTPYYIVYILNTFVGLTINPMGNLFLIIGLSNSLLNPVIYGAFQLCKVQFYTPSSWRRNAWRGTSPRLLQWQEDANHQSATQAGTPTSVAGSRESRKRLLNPPHHSHHISHCDGSCRFKVKGQKVDLRILGSRKQQQQNQKRRHNNINHCTAFTTGGAGGVDGSGGCGGDPYVIEYNYGVGKELLRKKRNNSISKNRLLVSSNDAAAGAIIIGDGDDNGAAGGSGGSSSGVTSSSSGGSGAGAGGGGGGGRCRNVNRKLVKNGDAQ